MSYRDPDGFVSFEGCRAVAESASGKALRIEIGASGPSTWIPKFAIHDDSEVYGVKPDQREGRLVVREDIALEKGLL